MDIFKLGDKILDLLNVIFAFWNNQVSLVFALLGQSPTAFKAGNRGMSLKDWSRSLWQ